MRKPTTRTGDGHVIRGLPRRDTEERTFAPTASHTVAGSGAIEARRLDLVPCELHHFEAAVTDRWRLGRMLGVTVPDDVFASPGAMTIEAMQYMYQRLKAEPDMIGWGTYLFVHTADRVLIGTGGYSGRSDEAGIVKIGYAIVPEYRNRGLTTEAAQGLIEHTFSHRHVMRVDAHTLGERNASVRVLEKAGMRFAETVSEPDPGQVWRWSAQKTDYPKGGSPVENVPNDSTDLPRP